jgi:hypothetical protein
MIYFIPLGDKNTASSRLRVHLVAPYLNAHVGVPERYEKGDVLIIQKVHAPQELHKARSQGATVIYDIDDPYLHRRAFQGMVESADLVTVDTESRKMYAEQFTKKQVVVIPDALDWDGITRTEEVNNGIACWTSYGNNAEFLEGVGIKMKLKLITTSDYKNYFSGDCDFVPWSIENVDEEIRKSEVMIIPLPDNETTKPKGRHKLLKAWANGVKCYVSPIPDYVEAMNEAGVGGKYIVKDWNTLKNPTEPLEKECIEYAKKFSADKVAEIWQSVIESL